MYDVLLYGNGLNRLTKGCPSWDDLLKDICEEERLKNDIAERVKNFPSNNIHEAVSKIKFSHYLTTNYDNVLLNLFRSHREDTTYKSENIYNIRRKFHFTRSKWDLGYWPIHSTSQNPKSIMLGLDQYCGSIAKMKQYISGAYRIHEYEQLVSLPERLRKGIEIDKVVSWMIYSLLLMYISWA